MPGVTLKVSSQTRSRIKALAAHCNKSMSCVIEEAMACYEKELRKQQYLEGWKRFQQDDPDGFAEYLGESREVEAGLADVIPE